MATRFYLPSSGTPPVSSWGSNGPSSTRWTLGATAFATFPMWRSKSNTALANGTGRTFSSNTVTGGMVDRLYVSEPLAGSGSLAGTFNMVIRGMEATASDNAWLNIIIRIVSNDGQTTRGVVYAGSTQTSPSNTASAENKEIGSTTGGPTLSTSIKSAIALTSTAWQAGDRIVAEIGFRKIAGGTANSDVCTLEYGDPSATADFALTGALTTSGDPWLEFSQTLTFQVVPPAIPASGRNRVLNPQLGADMSNWTNPNPTNVGRVAISNPFTTWTGVVWAWGRIASGGSSALIVSNQVACAPGDSWSAVMYAINSTGSSSASLSFAVNLKWYSSTGTLLSTTAGTAVGVPNTATWMPVRVTGTAPASAAFVAMELSYPGLALDDGAQMTAMRLDQVNDAALLWADGDQTGWTWDGPTDASASRYGPQPAASTVTGNFFPFLGP